MALVGSLLDQLSRDLSDPGFVRWTKEQLRTYLLEGLVTAFGKRPDLFMERRILKIESCSPIQTVCDCDRYYRVLGQATEGGRIIRPIRKRSSSQKLIWSGKPCRVSPDEFKLESYSIDPKTNTLEVYPAVPAGIDVWIVVECASKPTELKDGDNFNEELAVAAKQWVLSRAHRVDGEVNPIAFNLAKEHEATFWRVISFQMGNEMESAT